MAPPKPGGKAKKGEKRKCSLYVFVL
jgi:hypothetical protein